MTCDIIGTGKVKPGLVNGPTSPGPRPKKVTTTIKLKASLINCVDTYGSAIKAPITDGTFKVTLKSVTPQGANPPNCQALNQLSGRSKAKLLNIQPPLPPRNKPKTKTVLTARAALVTAPSVDISSNTLDLSGPVLANRGPMVGQTETVHLALDDTAPGCADPGSTERPKSKPGLKTISYTGTFVIS